MRIVAYCRVSTNHEDQKESLENQRQHYDELFNKLKPTGYQVPDVGLLYKANGTHMKLSGIYADEGISAAKRNKYRGAFNRMIEDAKRRLFDRVYVKSITRFSRRLEEGSTILKDLAEYGVEVIFEDGNLSSKNASHEMIIGMFLALAQEE